MAAGKEIRAGRAFVELGVRDTIAAGLAKAAARLKAFGATVSGLGLKIFAAGSGMLAPLLGAAKAFASMGDELAKASARTGISVERLSELKYAAEQSGSSLEDIETAAKFMGRTLDDAAQGTDTAQEALSRLGLTAAQLKDLSPDERFKLIADRLSQIKDPGTKAALAMEVFGRSAVNLLPLLNDGAAGIDALTKQAQRFGLTISTEDAKAAEEFGDRLDDLWNVVANGTFHLGRIVAQAVRPFVVWATEAMVKVRDWIKENQAMVVTALKVAAGIAVAGGALVAFGVGVSALGFAIGGVITTFSAMATVLGVVLSPLGLVIGSLALAGVAFFKFTETGGQAADFLKGKFAGLGEWFGEVMGAIRNSLTAGDIGGAAKVLWASLKVAWAKGTETLKGIWEEIKFTGLSVFYAWGGAIADFVAKAIGAIRTLASQAGNLFGRATESFVDNLTLDSVRRDARREVLEWFEGKTMGESEIKNLARELGIAGDPSAVDDLRKQFGGRKMGSTELAETQEKVIAKRLDDLNNIDKAARELRQKEHEERLAGIEAETNAALSGIREWSEKGLIGAVDSKEAANTEAEKELEAAQRELSKAIKAAAESAKDARVKRGLDEFFAFEGESEDGKGGEMGRISGMIKDAARGTFSALSFQSLQGGSGGELKQIAANTKASADADRELIAEIRKGTGGLRFT